MRIKIEGRLARWLIAFGYYLLRVWAATLRFKIEDRAGIVGNNPPQNYIGAVWHNRLLLMPYIIKKFMPERKGAALISASRDGELIAMLVKRFGFEVVRGSTSSGGTRAVMQLADVIASGHDAVITPDGPRGPAYQLGPGIVLLAQRTGAAVIPASLEYSGCWRVSSWDRFILPKPFATIRLKIGEPIRVSQTQGDGAFEAERVKLENALMSLVEMR